MKAPWVVLVQARDALAVELATWLLVPGRHGWWSDGRGGWVVDVREARC